MEDGKGRFLKKKIQRLISTFNWDLNYSNVRIDSSQGRLDWSCESKFFCFRENSAACNSNLLRFASTSLRLFVRLFVCIWHSQSLWPEKRWARRLCMFSSPIIIWLTTFSWFWNPKTLLLTAIFLRCELRASPRTRIWWGTSPGKFSTVWLLFVPQDCWGRDASSGAQSSELSLTQARCQRYQAQVTTPFLLNLN